MVYDLGLTRYDPEPIRIEASQKGWLLVRAISVLLASITNILAHPDHDWDAYLLAKNHVLHSMEQFERWYGKG